MKNHDTTCLICKNPCFYCSFLLNNKAFHHYCYQRILKKIKNQEFEIYTIENKIVILTQKLRQSKSFTNSFKRKVLLKHENLGSLEPRIECLCRDLKDLKDSKETYEKIVKKLYDYWPTFPPDWSERCRQTLERQKNCYSCGKDSDELIVRHKVPISKGGNHKPENLIALCPNCNSFYKSKIYKTKRIYRYHIPTNYT